MKNDINKRIEEIRVKYKEPPPPKEAKPKPSFERGEQRGQGQRPQGGQFRDRNRGGGGGGGGGRRLGGGSGGGKWRNDRRDRQG